MARIGIATGRSRGRFGISSGQSVRYLAATVYLTPLLLGFAAAFLFALVPQMQEVYLGLIEDRDWGRGIAGLAAVSLFSALLYAWNHIEVTRRIDAIYPDHADIDFDRRVLDVRDLKSEFAASLPFFGLLIGLAQVYRHVLDAAAALPPGALPALPALPEAVMLAAAITLAVYLALLVLFYRFRKSTKTQKRLLFFCYVLTVLLVATPMFASGATLMASRLLGPLAVTALVLVELAVGVRLLFWLLRKVFRLALALPSYLLMGTNWLPLGLRQAAIALVPLAAVAGAAAWIVQAGGGTGIETQPGTAAADAGDDLEPAFRSWLAERKTGPGRYPVFVVAAQGGGIYAASTTAAFLAAMQDHCPAFARHVFAVSAVSGGSVGASLFNAAFADSIARGTNRKMPVDVEPGCDSAFTEQGDLSKRLQAITEDDHISPLLAYLAPDFVRGLMPAGILSGGAEPGGQSPCKGDAAAWGSRERVLEQSFIDSFRRSGPSDGGAENNCANEKGASLLSRPFSESWPVKGDLPALILNATSVETGYRVAFAPFALHPFGSGTLFDFHSLSNPPADPTLMQAAIVSARFPGIMPPWRLDAGNGSRLTFVDGGYADSSGAATAVQLYNKLKQAGGADIDLYLIALTDKSKALIAAPGGEPAGTMPVRSWLYDALAPATTLLSVRDLQSRKAVTEARTALGDRMMIVQLDQKAFPLPLGWKLSGLSNDIIRLTLGDPAQCKLADTGDTALSIANRNSCELKRIVDLLSPPATPSQSLFASPLFTSAKPFAAATEKPAAAPASAKAAVATAKPESAGAKPAAPAPKALNAWAPSEP